MFGFQEILIITAILLGILFLPRMVAKRPSPRVHLQVRLPVKMRIALVASVVYPAIVAAFLQAWHQNHVLFLYSGIGPVLLGWLIYWVFLGYKKK